MILTHYHHKNDRPFQTLSSVSDKNALSIIASLKERTGSVYRRFNRPAEYLDCRRETESWLRDEFIKKGGKPIAKYPQYFVVDCSSWIEDGYNGQSRSIQIPISAFDADRVSFTYPDSMISYWLNSQTDRDFYHSEYHGKVFSSIEIREIIYRFVIPDRQWETDPTRKYDSGKQIQPENTIFLSRLKYGKIFPIGAKISYLDEKVEKTSAISILSFIIMFDLELLKALQ
jgi:hypothetical protein